MGDVPLDPEIEFAVAESRKQPTAELLHTVGAVPNPQNRWNIAARIVLEERRLEAERLRIEKDDARHMEIKNRLDELKKPHWTVNPNFWVTVVAAIAGIVAAYFSIFPRH